MMEVIMEVPDGWDKDFSNQKIVRCKDCKWWHESEREEGFGDCGQANGIMLKPSNWFCADGERKECR